MSPDLFTHNALVALLILLEPGIKSLGVAQARELEEAARAAADHALVDSHRDRMKVLAGKAKLKQVKKPKKESEKAQVPDALTAVCAKLKEVVGRSLSTAEFMQVRNAYKNQDPTSTNLHIIASCEDYQRGAINGQQRWDNQYLVLNLLREAAARYAKATMAPAKKNAAREWTGDE